MPRGIAAVFNSLGSGGVVGKPTGKRLKEGDAAYPSYERFVQDVRDRFAKWRWPCMIASLSIAAATTCFLMVPNYLNRMAARVSASMYDVPSIVLSALWTGLGQYACWLLLILCYQSFKALRKFLVAFELRVRPLDPDQSADDLLGDFCLRLTYLLTAVGTPLCSNTSDVDVRCYS